MWEEVAGIVYITKKRLFKYAKQVENNDPVTSCIDNKTGSGILRRWPDRLSKVESKFPLRYFGLFYVAKRIQTRVLEAPYHQGSIIVDPVSC